jgi:hypothetical protein
MSIGATTLFVSLTLTVQAASMAKPATSGSAIRICADEAHGQAPLMVQYTTIATRLLFPSDRDS